MNPVPLCIIPRFCSSHDALFEILSRESDLQPHYIDSLPRLDIFSLISIYCRAFGLMCKVAIAHIFYDDIRSVTYRRVNVGFSLNESVIRTAGRAKFFLGKSSFMYVKDAVRVYQYYSRLFSSTQVSLVLGGTEIYLYFSIVSQLAVLHGIHCYSIRGVSTIVAHPYNSVKLVSLPDFDHLSLHSPSVKCMELAERYLRLLELPSDSHVSVPNRQFFNHNDGKNSSCLPSHAFVLYCHDLIDAPGIYGIGPFSSHVQWLVSILEWCKSESHPIIVKSHPNQRPQSASILKNILSKYNTEDWLYQTSSLDISKLASLSPLAVLTGYGTITVEAAYSGILVVSLPNSPYRTFGISVCPPDKCSYFRTLGLIASRRLVSLDCSFDELKLRAVKAYAVLLSELYGMDDPVYYPFDDFASEIYDLFSDRSIDKHDSWKRYESCIVNSSFKRYLLSNFSNCNLAGRLGMSL